jgi:hypothetical protein
VGVRMNLSPDETIHGILISPEESPHFCKPPDADDVKVKTLWQCPFCSKWSINICVTTDYMRVNLWYRVYWWNFKARARIRQYWKMRINREEYDYVLENGI